MNSQGGTELLTNRVAVVTGGTSGIGASVIDALRHAGASPINWDITETADVPCDVSDELEVSAAMTRTVNEFGLPSLLVANAGVMGVGSVIDLDARLWDKTFAVNARGTFLCVRAVARSLIRAGQAGSIVIVGSVNGNLADPGLAAYSASKSAAMHFARVAARELGQYGIRVNAVAPGPTDTPMMADTGSIPGYRDEIAAATPLGRMGEPADVAHVVVSLLSMPWVTGQVLAADGGSSLCTARGESIAKRQMLAAKIGSAEKGEE